MAETPYTTSTTGAATSDANDPSVAQAALPEALRTPTKRLGFGFILMLCLANVALWFSMQPVTNILIAEQVDRFDPNPSRQIFYNGLVLFGGALLSVFSNPIGGALSDRTTSRFGRRVPWLIGCGALSAGTLIMMANANGVALLFIGYGLYQLIVNGALAALTAVVPDKASERQRGFVSAFVGLTLPVATVLGAVVVGLLVTNIQIGYYILAATLVVVMVLFSFTLHDARLPRSAVAPFRLGEFLRGFWISPRKYPDFGWAFLSRFLVNVGWNTTVGGLLYQYLKYGVKVSNPAASVAIAQIIAVVMIVLSSIVGGYLSDRFQRRKVFVIISAATIAVALLVLALVTSWVAVLVAAVIVGLGFGAYLAVDLALLTEVLPSASDRAKDMGVFNIANALPGAIGPLAAGILVPIFGSFQPLFFMATGVVLIAALTILPIKSVR
ncbi:MAG TPA: MFS transporter [Ktedonobacterales bacterium]|nr:MFS transporter [Ktedonobacterales bacterium]